METFNFLQRPGGLGPTSQRVKPLGAISSGAPAMYQNTPQNIELTRAANSDNVNRVMSQIYTDRGENSRAAVGPTDFQKGNIVPSQQLTGPAGYNHRNELVIPERPMDMTKADYLVKLSNETNPELRNQLKMLTVIPRQNFLDTPDVSGQMLTQNYNMPDNLPMQLPTKVQK